MNKSFQPKQNTVAWGSTTLKSQKNGVSKILYAQQHQGWCMISSYILVLRQRMVKRSRLLVRMLYKNFLKHCQRTSTTEIFSTTGFSLWICVENWSPLAFWFQLQQDLIELANVPLWQKKIWKKKAVVAMTTVQTWALDLLLRNSSTVNVFTCAQRMLVCKQIHQRLVSRGCPRIQQKYGRSWFVRYVELSLQKPGQN